MHQETVRISNRSNLKIGLVELKHAFHGFAGLINAFNQDNIHLTLFTTQNILQHVCNEVIGDPDQLNWVLKGTDEDNKNFLQRAEHQCQHFDLVIVNSIQIQPFVHFNPRCKKLFVIYNTNWWLQPTRSLKEYIKGLKSIKFNLHKNQMRNSLTGPLLRRKILSLYDGIIVESWPIKKYVLEYLKYNKKVFIMPNFPYIPTNSSICSKNIKNVHFVIPGKIENRRRDYKIIHDVFLSLKGKNINAFELTLLGEPKGAYGTSMRNKFERLKNNGTIIRTFNEFVPAEKYHAIMKSADVILAPLKIDFRFDVLTEKYTLTKGSGNISDAVYFGKPIILPAQCQIESQMQNAVQTYRDINTLEAMLAEMITDKNRVSDFKQKAVNTYKKHYSLIECQKNTREIISALGLEF